MIDPVSSKAVTSASDLRTDTVKVEKVAPVTAVAQAGAAERTNMVTLGASEAAKAMAAKPPVDADRVAQIRKAVQEGKFPIYPSTVADRLIAFEQGWRWHEQG